MSITTFFSRILDIIAPRRCTGCGQRLFFSEEEICVTCLISLPRTYFWKRPDSNILTDMFLFKAHIEKAASWFFYSGNRARNAIRALKYKGRYQAGIIYGSLMATEIKDSGFFDGIDAIMPMPLAKNRLRQRGYNQCMMVALGINKETNIPIIDGAVKRNTFKKSQTRLNHLERQENVKNQYSVIDASLIRGKHILVVDDVITTGSTVTACITPMLEVEGVKVSVLSLAFTF